MGTQFSHKISFPRLEREGRKHWFDGTVMPHPRQDLQALFERLYQEALDAGYSLDNYRMQQVFGAFPKYSQKTYSGNSVTRPKHWWKRLFRKKAKA